MKEYARFKIASATKDYPRWRAKWLPEDGLILDAGCGPGALSHLVGEERYHGIDANDDFVDHCVQRNLKVRKGSVTGIPYPADMFAGVFCSHVIEHLYAEEQQAAMDEFFRVLEPEGTLTLYAPTPYSWYFWDDPTHIRPLTHGSLEIIAKNSGFKVLSADYSGARFLPKWIQRYFRVLPLPFLFWEVCIVCRKPASTSPASPASQ